MSVVFKLFRKIHRGEEGNNRDRVKNSRGVTRGGGVRASAPPASERGGRALQNEKKDLQISLLQ